MAPLDPRYTQFGFNFIFVQVCPMCDRSRETLWLFAATWCVPQLHSTDNKFFVSDGLLRFCEHLTSSWGDLEEAKPMEGKTCIVHTHRFDRGLTIKNVNFPFFRIFRQMFLQSQACHCVHPPGRDGYLLGMLYLPKGPHSKAPLVYIIYFLYQSRESLFFQLLQKL